MTDIRPFRIEIPQAERRLPARPARPCPLARRTARRRAGPAACRWSYLQGARRVLADRLRLARPGGAGSTSTRSSRRRSTASASTSCTSRSDQPDAKPLLITHGFPSSVAEFLHLIEPLVNPAEGQAFHVVAPSLPGYAFSTPLGATGWTMGRTARAWVELMRRLGYERYGVHGGDIGAGVSGMVAGLDGEHVIGVHVVTDPLTAANVGHVHARDGRPARRRTTRWTS